MRGTDRNPGIWRPSLEEIDSTDSSQLGPGRVTGNEQGPCFSRQISMYLARSQLHQLFTLACPWYLSAQTSPCFKPYCDNAIAGLRQSNA